MEKITAEDLHKIAYLLKIQHGVKLIVIPNEFINEGTAFLMMSPADINEMREIFEPLPK